MAPMRRKYIKRRRVIRPRYRKRAPIKRRYGGKRRSKRGKTSPLQRAIRRSTKKVTMGHYKNPNMYRKVCDVINIGAVECPHASDAPLAQYKNLKFTLQDLPRLNELLSNSNDPSTVGKFSDFKIDKVTYKCTVINARRLQMEPNYLPPDGTGITSGTSMLHPEEYALKNSYIFHTRYQNDEKADGTFGDWSLLECAQKGAIKYTSFFRQRGRMFQTPATYTKSVEYSYNGVTTKKDIQGVPMGWMERYTVPNTLQIGNAGIIVPGIRTKGWDDTTDNPIPRIEVSVRVCSRVRNSAFSIDKY